MHIWTTLALALLALAACRGDETISARTGAETVYALQSLDGAPFPAPATIRFPEPGRVAGRGPCNSYGAAQSVPYPWIEIGPIAATRTSCPRIAAESRYFAALQEMEFAEVQGPVLLLSNGAGRQMTFRAR